MIPTLVLAFGLVASPPISVDTIDSKIAEQLDAANVAFSAAYLAGDWEAIVAMYTEDAVLHPPAGGVLVGESMVAGYWKPIENGSQSGHRLEGTYRRMVGSANVLEVGAWNSRRASDGVESDWSRGCYTLIWERQADGRWLIAFDGWTNPIEADWACVPRWE